MKKRSFILVVLMVICSAFCLVGCGEQGPQGEKGDKGEQGIQGLPGDKGEDGEDGKDGRPGERGPQGIQGIQGEKGDKGDKGEDGREVEFMVDALGIKWRYVGEEEWKDLLTFEDLDGYSRTYTVKFDADGGEAIADKNEVLYKTELELPTPVKEGFHFLGWRVVGGDETLYNGTYTIKKNVEFKAVWAYTVNLNLNGGEIIGKFQTVDELKTAFYTDLNAWGNYSYAVGASVVWNANVYKFFQDPVYGPLWAPFLQYIIDVETNYKETVVPTLPETGGDINQDKFDLYPFFADLVAGKDLTAIAKDSAPYCITYSLNAFFNKKQEVGIWHITADYSSDEVYNKVIDYYIPCKDTTLYVEVGQSVLLPTVAKADVNFRGFFAGEEQVAASYTPTANVDLKAVFGAGVVLNTNVDDVDVVNEDVPASIVIAEDGEDVTLPTITRNNYKFLGWFAGAEKVEVLTKASAYTALTAKWEGDAHTVKFNRMDNVIEDLATVYGQKVGTMIDGTKEGMVFDGWWTLDGSTTGEWGEQVTASTVVRKDLVLYAKFKQPYTVTLNYNDGLRPATNGAEVRASFIKDFYDWCLAKEAFTAADMPFEKFVGENYNGMWFSYIGAGTANPSDLYPVVEDKGNYLCAIVDGTIVSTAEQDAKMMFSDATLNAKYAPFFDYIYTIFNQTFRVYEMGRYMQSFNEANPYVTDEMMTALPTGCEKTVAAVGGAEEKYVTFVIGEEAKLPTPTKEGYAFNGWFDGTNYYDTFNTKDIDGKTLTATFTKAEENILTVGAGQTYATIKEAIAAAKPGNVIKVVAGEYMIDPKAEDPIVIDKRLTIVGPNEGVNPNTGERAAEAIMKSNITIKSSNVTLDGLYFTGYRTILIEGNVENITMQNLFIDGMYGAGTSGGRTGLISMEDGNSMTNFTFTNCKAVVPGAIGRNLFAFYGMLENLELTNNVVTNGDVTGNSEIIRAQRMAGIVNIKNNDIVWGGSSFTILMGNSLSLCTEINLINNRIAGGATNAASGIAFYNMDPATTTNIIGNKFENVGGNVFSFSGYAAGSNVNILYNLFNETTSFQCTNVGEATVVTNNNCYLGGQTETTGHNPNLETETTYETLEALEAAYAEYRK